MRDEDVLGFGTMMAWLCTGKWVPCTLDHIIYEYMYVSAGEYLYYLYIYIYMHRYIYIYVHVSNVAPCLILVAPPSPPNNTGLRKMKIGRPE